MTPEQRERRIREIAQRLAERLAAEWPEGDLTINDIEELAERLGHEVQREISERGKAGRGGAQSGEPGPLSLWPQRDLSGPQRADRGDGGRAPERGAGLLLL